MKTSKEIRKQVLGEMLLVGVVTIYKIMHKESIFYFSFWRSGVLEYSYEIFRPPNSYQRFDLEYLLGGGSESRSISPERAMELVDLISKKYPV